MSNDNQHVAHQVDDFVHGLLDESAAAEVETHCAQCTDCREALEAARRRHAALKSLPPVEASQSLIQKALERVDRSAQRRRTVWKWYVRSMAAAAAVTLLVLGSLHVYFANLRPTPCDIRVLGQRNLLAGTEARLRIGVFDGNRGEPLADVPLTVRLNDRRSSRTIQLASFRSGSDGRQVATLKLPEWPEGDYDLQVVAETGGRQEAVLRQVTLRRDWKLMLSSDKPVYQPGQTIRLRSLALRRPDLKPVADEPVTFQVEDPKGNRIFLHKTSTSRFGIASADCPLASEILTGNYQVRCRVGEVESRLTVEVRKYVLPKFKVEVEPDRSWYLPGQEARLTIRARYFFGRPVDGGNVVLKASSPQRHGDPVEATLDAEGTATVPLQVPGFLVGLPQELGTAPWGIVVEVTDSAGQVEAIRQVVRVADTPIQLNVVPAGGKLLQGISNTIFVHATYPDGTPAAARIDVLGHGDPRLVTDSLGVASFELTPPSTRLPEENALESMRDAHPIVVELTAEDDRGNRTRRRVELVSGGGDGDFLLLSDRGVYRSGDTVQLTLRGGGQEPVFVDVLRDGQTVLSQTVPMSEGAGELALDLPPDLFGTLRIVAYRFGPEGLAFRRSRMIFVQRASDLKIQAELDAESYRPGERARLRLRLTDQAGQPVPGAISLAAVDEAVFSVLGQRPGMERTFFQLESELLTAMATIYGWSPFDPPAAAEEDHRRLERAVFAWTSHAARGDSVVPVRLSGGRRADRRWQEQHWTPIAARASAPRYLPEPHTLAASSFPAKEAQIRRLRRERLEQIVVAWSLAAGTFVLLGLAALAYFRPLIFLATLALGVVGMCMLGLLALPAVQMARDAVDATGGMAQSAPRAERRMAGAASGEIRVREDFPETLLWEPQLITNDRGEVELDIDLADSITTWRVSAGAVSAEGQLGGERFPLRVFQPFFVDFNLPVALTRHDEVAVPVVVYNYLDEPQTVEITLREEEWFELLPSLSDQLDAAEGNGSRDASVEAASPTRTLRLEPGEVRSVAFPLKALRVGRHNLRVDARGGEITDAVRREVEVVPNGQRTQHVASGLLSQPFEQSLDVPDDIVPGSAAAVVTLHPTRFSQVVEGLDAILRMPHGCFEQTSSATYPNVLALQYLRSNELNSPAVEAKARQYIHVGYQRLLSFEVSGGGFDWFGRPPANLVLTAYGLMEFHDMAQVHDVDPDLIRRTRNWLRERRDADGGWPVEQRGILELAGRQDPRLIVSAYIGWALARNGDVAGDEERTLAYLLAHEPATIEDPYTLAIVTNAVAALSPGHAALPEYVRRLSAMSRTDVQADQAWWEQPAGNRTAFHGGGEAGQVETTAMATLALQQAGGDPRTIRGALNWLLSKQDAQGTWHSTQATILALQCLLAGAPPADDEEPRTFDVVLNGELIRSLEVPPDQLSVVQRVELPDLAPGSHQLRLTDRSGRGAGYHLVFRYWREVEEQVERAGPLAIEVEYDRRQLPVDEVLGVTATVQNQRTQPAPMVMLDLPIPPGFEVERQDWDALQARGTIARYEVTARQILVYLRRLQPGERLELEYRLRATMPVRVRAPEAEVYEYYNPRLRARGGATQLIVQDA